MKMLLAVIFTVAAAKVVEGSLEPGLRVKFDMGADPSAGTSYFFNVPRTITEVVEEGWRKVRSPPGGPLPQLELYCPSDKGLCVFLDDNGYAAGLQIALPKYGTINAFDWAKRGFRIWNTAVDGKCVSLWTIQQYFVSSEYLQKSKEERLAAYDNSRLLQENAIWLTSTDGELLKVSSSEEDIVNENVFTKQACLPWMGQHYYYNMSTTTPCEAEHMYPWFPMTMNGELIASGFLTFASSPVAVTDRFERPDEATVRMIVPYAPECMYELCNDPGVITMHIYYTKTPWMVTC